MVLSRDPERKVSSTGFMQRVTTFCTTVNVEYRKIDKKTTLQRKHEAMSAKNPSPG
jgi:hypothetical protein